MLREEALPDTVLKPRESLSPEPRTGLLRLIPEVQTHLSASQSQGPFLVPSTTKAFEAAQELLKLSVPVSSAIQDY